MNEEKIHKGIKRSGMFFEETIGEDGEPRYRLLSKRVITRNLFKYGKQVGYTPSEIRHFLEIMRNRE